MTERNSAPVDQGKDAEPGDTPAAQPQQAEPDRSEPNAPNASDLGETARTPADIDETALDGTAHHEPPQDSTPGDEPAADPPAEDGTANDSALEDGALEDSGETAADVPAAPDVNPVALIPAPGTPSGGLRLPRPSIRVVRRPEHTAALRESLAEKEAEARDLRISIEQLRQELSSERASMAGRRRRRYPWYWITGVAAVVVLLGIISRCTAGSSSSAVGTPGSGGSTPPAGTATPSAAPSASAAASSSASQSASSTTPSRTLLESSPPAAPSPMAWQGTSVLEPPGLLTSGPGIDQPGTDAAYAFDADGRSVDVFERVQLGEPSAVLSATLPSRSQLSGDLAAAELTVQNLQVALDGQAVIPDRSADGVWRASNPSGALITRAVLRYRLVGAVLRVEPSSKGRYSGLLLPLTVGAQVPPDHPLVVHVVGKGLVQVICPTATGKDLFCATPSATGVSVTVPVGTTPIVQLTLDR